MALLKDSLITGDLRVTGTIFGNLKGNAETATTLQTARTINGTNFNGSANITTANWGTTRTISIGSTAGTTGTSVNGSANVSLIIPSTMTGFSSITSTTFVGALNGNATSATKATKDGDGNVISTTYLKATTAFSIASASTITGNGSATSFAVTHAFDSRDVIVQVYDLSDYATVDCDVVRTNNSTVTISFATAPASSKTYRVLITSMTIMQVPDVNNTSY